MGSSLQDLVSSNRVAKNRIDQHPPAIAREENQHLPADLAHLDDVLPAHPPAVLPEPRENAVLVHDADLAEKDVIAVLHDRGDERAEEQQDERRERQELHLLPCLPEL